VYSLLLSPVVLQNDDGEFSLVSSDMNERFNVGYFKTLESAQEYVASSNSREFSNVIIPNDEIADAFGIDFRAIRTFGNRGSIVSDKVMKLSCSRIDGGLY